MVELQILNSILQTKDISIIENNQLDVSFFPEYKEEYEYIIEHYKEYGNIPDKATFLSEFQDFEFFEVEESEDYLVSTIREENLFNRAVPVVQKIAKLMKTNSNDAVEYMMQSMKELQPNYHTGGVDIIQNATDRYNAYIDRRDNQQNWFFTTGFPELDDITHGINRAEEFFLIIARPNIGKSFILEKIITHIWEIGFNVGYISPEMGELSIGYRFDTLYNHFSNQGLMWGKKDFDENAYAKYIEELKKHNNKFIVATPLDFGNKMTVSKLKNFIKEHKLDALAIDGLAYVKDERGNKHDNKTTALTNVSEDLKSLGMELKVPILSVLQVNRTGVTDKTTDDTPELDSVRDSDGPAFNATTVIALKQSDDNIITLQVRKGRGNRVNDKMSYRWNPDIGEFLSEHGSITSATRQKKKPVEKEDVF